jgi:uncharacterized protein
MSEIDLDTVQEGYDAFNEGNVDGLLIHTHPDVVWHDAPQIPGAEMRVGHEEVRGYLESFSRVWDAPRFDPEEMHTAGDAVVVLARFSGQGRQSGAGVATEVGHMFRWRDGKVYRVITYFDHEQALAALEELREQAEG